MRISILIYAAALALHSHAADGSFFGPRSTGAATQVLSGPKDDDWRSSGALQVDQHRRRLSRSDRVRWKGEQNSSAPVNRYLYVFIHVPKNAGASFMKDSPKHLPKGAVLRGSREKAVYHGFTQHLLKSFQRTRLVLLLRHPVKMAYSQFLMCKYSNRLNDKGFPRRGEGVQAGVTLWAQALLRRRNTSFAFSCYHARDVQARYLATSESAWRAPSTPPLFAKAVATIERAYFVGLAEAYPESACLLRMLTTHQPVEYCRCGSSEKGPRLTHERHKVPKANLADLTQNELQLLAKLVPRDVRLYARAVEKLDAHRRRVDALFGGGAGGCSVTERLRRGVKETLCTAYASDGNCSIPAKFGWAGARGPDGSGRAARGVARWQRAGGVGTDGGRRRPGGPLARRAGFIE